jgi:RNA polymerase sigma-70 factor (TIGR02960 family)
MMRDDALSRAQAGDEVAFRQLTDDYRRELQHHCYRILGSAQDAEDALQETLVSAWRNLDRFEGRASLRTWLYRIATNRCLDMLRAGARRAPAWTPMTSEFPEPTRRLEVSWIEPYPDHLDEGPADDSSAPEARYDARESLELAFIIALQHLPPRQRAVFLLRDLLGFRAAEVADMLDTTEDSVTSALRRARSTIDERVPSGSREQTPLAGSAAERRLVSRFVDAFEAADVDRVIALLTEDASFSMPPEPLEYVGHEDVARILTNRFAWRGETRVRLVPTRANTQPAFGFYVEDPHTPIARAHGLVVLTLSGDRISAITRFLDNSVLPLFGLPRRLPD